MLPHPHRARLALLLAAILALPLPLSAYAAFESVQAAEPAWLRPSPAAQPEGDVIYRMVRRGGEVAIEVRNRGAISATVAWSLPGWCPPGTLISAVVPAHGNFRQVIPVLRLDQELLQAQVAPPGAAAPDVMPLPIAMAYGAVAASEDARFASTLLSYTADKVANGDLDIHLRWEGDRPLHAAWRLVGAPGLTLPRLHLLPGQIEEVILAAPAWSGPGTPIIEVWDVRLGNDQGPTSVADAAMAPALLPQREGWSACGSGEPAQGGWNAAAVHWQAVAVGERVTGIRLWNRAPQALALRWWLLDGPPGGSVDLAGGAELTLPLAGPGMSADQLLWVMTAPEGIDGQALPGPWTGASPLALPGGQPVQPQRGDGHFNPAQVMAQAHAAANGGVAVTVVNRLACQLDAVIAVGGARAAISLAPGASATAVLPGLRYSAALATAPVAIAEVRLDRGEACCGTFD